MTKEEIHDLCERQRAELERQIAEILKDKYKKREQIRKLEAEIAEWNARWGEAYLGENERIVKRISELEAAHADCCLQDESYHRRMKAVGEAAIAELREYMKGRIMADMRTDFRVEKALNILLGVE